MRQTFRIKLLAILAIATGAFTMLLVVGSQFEERADDQLARIAQQYIPRLELGPQLAARFDELVRGFRDAVAAQDAEALQATRALRDACLNELAGAAAIVPRADAAALRTAIDDYHFAAFDVSRRLLAKETGEALVEAIDDMQAKQRNASALLTKATAFDQSALTRAFATATSAQTTARHVRLVISVSSLTLVLLLCLWLSRSVLRALRAIGDGFARVGEGVFDVPIQVQTNDEFGALAEQANQMARSLKAFNDQRDRTEWLTEGLSGLVREVRGELEPDAVAEHATRYLARYLGAPAAALYWRDAEGTLSRLSHYATWTAEQPRPPGPIALGDGLLGQSAREQDITIITDLPEDFFPLRSALGSGKPRALVLLPLVRLGQVCGVLELAVLKPWTEADSALLLSVRESLAIAIEVARARTAMRALLAETQQQAQRLRSQEDALRSNNEELQAQQEELLNANTVLKMQAGELERQRGSLQLSNAELHEVRRTLEQKAKELSAVSAFKSQFLANMSHELRTPLNSMLILSSLLADHEAGELTEKQTEYCRTIHGAAKNLLALINQVLDLAKVESGKQELVLEPVLTRDLADYARRLFEPLARDKKLDFVVEYIDTEVPESIVSDRRKIEQILNNLLGNAIKFTAHGSVTLRFGAPASDRPPQRAPLHDGRVLSLSVRDTGAGIPAVHQERIFAPFEQLEATPDRRYGGSGLGLSIARELVTLLGGELQLESREGEGSVFFCYLPWQPPSESESRDTPVRNENPPAREEAATPPPLGAVGPACEEAQRACRILIVEDESDVAEALLERLRADRFEAVVANTAEAALRCLAGQSFQCVVLDLGLPDSDGLELLATLHERHRAALPPVLVHTGRALTDAELSWLESHAEIVVLKHGLALDRLVDEIRLFSRRLDEGLPRRAGTPTIVPAARVPLTDRKVLVVDDDMRTVYAVSALLRARGIELMVADTGRAALEILNQHPDIELVLMDISMPEMDGHEAMRRIRLDSRFQGLPIIALTARVTKGDRAACLISGATDYLPKPVDADLLLALVGASLSHPTRTCAGERGDAPVSNVAARRALER